MPWQRAYLLQDVVQIAESDILPNKNVIRQADTEHCDSYFFHQHGSCGAQHQACIPGNVCSDKPRACMDML